MKPPAMLPLWANAGVAINIAASTNRKRSTDLSPSCPGHSRPKDGVASLAYGTGHPRL
jgi:hypothetical protein